MLLPPWHPRDVPYWISWLYHNVVRDAVMLLAATPIGFLSFSTRERLSGELSLNPLRLSLGISVTVLVFLSIIA